MRARGRNFIVKLGAVLALAFFFLRPAAAADEILAVKVKKANFRAGPSMRSQVLFTADKNYPVQVISRRRDWCRVKDFEGEVAWVAGRLLADVRCIAVKVKKANIRQRPTVDSPVLYVAERGAAFRVLERSGRWLKVEHVSGASGWLHRALAWGRR